MAVLRAAYADAGWTSVTSATSRRTDRQRCWAIRSRPRAGDRAGQGRPPRAAADRLGEVNLGTGGRCRDRRAGCAVLAVSRGSSRPTGTTPTPTQYPVREAAPLKGRRPGNAVAGGQDLHRRVAGVSSFGFGGTNSHVVPESAFRPWNRLRRRMIPDSRVAGGDHAGGIGQYPGAGVLVSRGAGRWMAGAGRRRRWTTWPTPSTTIAAATPCSPRCVPDAAAPGPVRRRWPMAGRGVVPALRAVPAGHGVRLLRAGARSGPAWACGCSPTNRRSPPPSTNSNRRSSGTSVLASPGDRRLEEVHGDAGPSRSSWACSWRHGAVALLRRAPGRGDRARWARSPPRWWPGADTGAGIRGDRGALAADVAAGGPGRSRYRCRRHLDRDAHRRLSRGGDHGYLSPRQTVVAGSVAAIEALLTAAVAANQFARRVNMEVASHTALMDLVLEALQV